MDERTGKSCCTCTFQKILIPWIHAAIVCHVSIYFSAYWNVVDNHRQKLIVTVQVSTARISGIIQISTQSIHSSGTLTQVRNILDFLPYAGLGLTYSVQTTTGCTCLFHTSIELFDISVPFSVGKFKLDTKYSSLRIGNISERCKGITAKHCFHLNTQYSLEVTLSLT